MQVQSPVLKIKIAKCPTRISFWSGIFLESFVVIESAEIKPGSGLILADGSVLIALDRHTNQQAGPTLGQQVNTQDQP